MTKILAIFIVLTFTLLALSPAQQPDANRRLIDAAGSAAEYPGSATLVLYDSTNVDVQESGLSYVLMHTLTKILTPAGARDMRTVTVDYDPLSAAVEIRFVRIYRANGSAEILPPERILDEPAPARAIYWGARDKIAEIGRLEAGDAVETIIFRKGFTYALLADAEDDSRFIPPMRGHFYDIVEFWSSVPVMEKVYRVTMPKGKPLQFETYNGELSSSVHFPPEKNLQITLRTNPQVKESSPASKAFAAAAQEKIVYTWSRKNILPFKQEPGMTAVSDVAPKLLLSTAPDWYAKAVWFNKVNEDYKSFDTTPELKALADKLLAGVTDEMQKISILTHWAAEEIRYSGISMGKGEGYTLHPGGMTLLDRCGVCKDKAGILVSLLRAAGFVSYPAMTMAGSRIDRIPADQFNHSVTLVRRSNGDWMLLDPTWVPGVRELWSSAEQQQEVLMGIPGGAELMTTPVSPAENHYWRLTGESALSEEGTLEGTLTLEAEGQSDAGIRRVFLRNFTSGWKEYIPLAFAAISSRAEILDQKFTDPTDLSKPMRIEVRYRIPGYALVTGSQFRFTPLLARNPFNDGAMSSEMSTDTSMALRKYGFRMRCSKLTEVSEKVTLPKYSAAILLPSFATVAKPCASFSGSYELRGNTLSVSMRHAMEKRVYDAGDWPDFRAALVERMKFSSAPVIFSR